MGRGRLLRGRGRAVYQRPHRLDRLPLRRRHDAPRRAADRGADRGRRLELRGRERRDRSSFSTTINVVEGLLAYERANGGRRGAREARRAARSTCSTASCSAGCRRARSSTPTGSGSRSPVVALRRPARARSPARCWPRSGGRAHRRGDLDRGGQARRRRPLAARAGPRAGWVLLRDGGRGGEPQPLDHAHRAPRARVGGRASPPSAGRGRPPAQQSHDQGRRCAVHTARTGRSRRRP